MDLPAKYQSRGTNMAARWGTGEETLTIGGMEFFTAGGAHQCHELGEDESCDGLSTLSLSSLDAGGILGTFHGYIDNSIISIIDDTGAQAENKGHYDEENELSLLTALTEILDNADDENISPFDTIPDTELLVSSKSRESSLIDGRCSGTNWDLFPDSISSTPKRHNRHKIGRVCLPRRERRLEPSRQRSDGEDEDLSSPEKNTSLLNFDKEFSIEMGQEIKELDNERLIKYGTPCIINTENVSLNDLVKYMHPYSLPAIAVCIEPEDSESLLDEAVFLEIVSEQGECIKVPVVVEHPGEMLSLGHLEDSPSLESSEELDVTSQLSAVMKPTLEQSVPDCKINCENHVSCTENSMSLINKVFEPTKEKVGFNKEFTVVPGLDEISSIPLTDGEPVNKHLNEESNTVGRITNDDGVVPDCQKNHEPVISSGPVSTKERVQVKVKKPSKEKQPNTFKSKVKSQTKGASEDIQPPTRSLSNPALQESDLLVKTLEINKVSQMELRSSKMGRTRGRPRLSLDNSNVERKMPTDNPKELIQTSIDNEQPCSTTVVTEMDGDLGKSNAKSYGDQPTNSDVAAESAFGDVMESDEASSQNTLVSDEASGPDFLVSAASATQLKEASVLEELSPSAGEDVIDCDSAQSTKEAKPKSLSLSEYRKRLQHRKPDPERENKNVSSSKWPSIPEAPTELAELPCLIVPTKSNKPSVEAKPSIPNKPENTSGEDVPVSLHPVLSHMPSPPVSSHEAPQLKPNEAANQTVVEITPPPMIPSQPNVPPPFYPPAWPNIPPYPAYYPGMPPLPVVPHFPNCIPPIIPMQPPPPMPSWPSYPPPPIPVGPVPPVGWVSGMPPPLPPTYWSNPQLPQRMPDTGCMQTSQKSSVPFSVPSLHGLPDQMPKDTPVPAKEYSNLTSVPAKSQPNPKPIQTSKHGDVSFELSKPIVRSLDNASSIAGPQVYLNLKKSDPKSSSSQSVGNVESKPPSDSIKANVTAPDRLAANQVVLKIMDILKKAEKHGFRIKPPLVPSVSGTSTPTGGEKSVLATLKTVEPVQAVIANDKKINVSTPVEMKPSCLAAVGDKIPAIECDTSKEVLERKLLSVGVIANQKPRESVLPSPGGDLCTTGKSIQPTLPVPDQKEPEESSACVSGIEASDLNSLLEQFEKYEAKDEACHPHSPDTSAVGISGSGKSLNQKHLAPELGNSAGVVHPVSPIHPLHKSGASPGKAKPSHGPERSCSSAVKTTKLIEAKPLPQSKLRNRNLGTAAHVSLPPVHVASGEHDYCILSASRPGQGLGAAGDVAPSQGDEGSRWNVKHHQNITIKPIVQFNAQQNIPSPKVPTASAPSVVHPTTSGGLEEPVAACKSRNDPLDHRIPVIEESATNSPPGSMLKSPDSSSYHSECGVSRTDVKRDNDSVSRRSLRCYRKQGSSPSPQKSIWSERSTGSHSSSSQSSSRSRSRSRSMSPPSKRRRTYRSRSHHRSRSSSGSSYSSRNSSRSSSPSSRSCSPSSSRSRSPPQQRYHSRSKRYISRDQYEKQTNYQKEQAIEERRVVYIGKINSHMTRSELRERFSIFGEIEDCTLHFREHGDNYGFVTYRCTEHAFDAIERGHKLRLPDELPFDLCFGGRRQFCKSNYADLDSNRDDFNPVPVRSKFETLDFETLLREAQKSHRR